MLIMNTTNKPNAQQSTAVYPDSSYLLIQSFRKAVATGFIGQKRTIISSALVEAVLEQIDSTSRFLEAADEVAESEELSYGYDLFKDGSYNFFENNRALILELIGALADKNNRASTLDFIYNCIDTDIFTVERKHSDAIINNSTEINSKILEGDCMMTVDALPADHTAEDYNESCMRDAYESVTYQLGAHCIMKTCEAFNDYRQYLVAHAA